MTVQIIRKKRDTAKCHPKAWPFPPHDQHIRNPQTNCCVRCGLPFDEWEDKTLPHFVLPDSMLKDSIKKDVGL